MKFKAFLTCMAIIFLAEIFALIWFANADGSGLQDAVEVNAAARSVEADWKNIAAHKNVTGLDYTVLDNDGNVLFATRSGLSESINEAVIKRDTILDIEAEDKVVGKIIIHSDSSQRLSDKRKKIATVVVFAVVVQFALCALYSVHIDRRVVKPFKKLENFAERVAGGNLDIPLEMDRENIFGAFTEGFDIMRSELKKSP